MTLVLLALVVLHGFAFHPAMAFPDPQHTMLCLSEEDEAATTDRHGDAHADHGSDTGHPHKSHPAGSCCTTGCGPAVISSAVELTPQRVVRGERVVLPAAWSWQDTVFRFDRPPRLSA
jgi:hypothetical protein